MSSKLSASTRTRGTERPGLIDSSPVSSASPVVESLSFRHQFAHIVSTLTRILGPRHLSVAEEAAQDALIKALQIWPHDGVPSNPSAWLIQVARNRAIDVLRREQRFETWGTESAQNQLISASSAGSDLNVLLRGEPSLPDDDELLMMFLVCHPALPRARVYRILLYANRPAG